MRIRFVMLVCVLMALWQMLLPAATVSYDIVYVRAPRNGDATNTKWPDVFHPMHLEPGSDLMLLHPDGREEVLVAAGKGAVTDPCISFDAQWIYYSFFPDVVTQSPLFVPSLPAVGSDIYKINVRTRQIVRLTHQEFTPNTGVSVASRELYGTYNMGPCPVSGGKIVFTSNRNGFIPPKNYTPVTLQLFVMDEDGSNVTPIGPMTLGSALHPMQLKDGRIIFSSMESQGLRDARLWSLWSIWPDGREWAPVMSAFANVAALHFSTQLSGGDIVVEDYYNLNNNGFGTFYRFPSSVPAGSPAFHSGIPSENPPVAYTDTNGARLSYNRFAFTPVGLTTVTPFTHPFDEAAPKLSDGTRAGKVTLPSAAPNNDLLLVWTPGPANNLNRPTTAPYYDAGIYLARGGGPVDKPSDLVLIKNDPAYNEQWPRALLSYQEIYGVSEPADLPWLPNDGSVNSLLPAGTPYGIVGTSSLYKRESWPGFKRDGADFDGLDAFNGLAYASSNWEHQGSDAGKYGNDEICSVRIIALEPTSQGTRAWANQVHERMRILGEIPVRRSELDAEGNPDTSFWARVPADTPFTFQMTDCEGRTLTMAQTWHQVRPGEVRTNCGGCHAHSQQPLPFAGTAASRQAPVDLTKTKPIDIEFLRDIRPLLQRSCVSCHKGDAAPGSLRLDDLTVYKGTPPDSPSVQQPGDYMRLARDAAARWGYKPLQTEWRGSNASRYVRKLQSRRSLLAWKVFGRRLDGWTNASFPTESVPGDPATFPANAIKHLADLDYSDTVNHASMLSAAEKGRIARWIDIGAPIDMGGGYFDDELRPTLTVSSPRPNSNAGPIREIRIGIADYYSGLDDQSLTVTADIAIDGRAPGSNLAAAGGLVGEGIFSIPVTQPFTGSPVRLTVRIKDKTGNWAEQVVRFWVGSRQSAAGPRPPSNVRLIR